MQIETDKLLDALRQRKRPMGADLMAAPLPSVPQDDPQQPGIGDALIRGAMKVGSAYFNRDEPQDSAPNPMAHTEEFDPYGRRRIHGYRRGGRYDRDLNRPMVVGEDGPEVIVPDKPGTVIPTDELERALRGIPAPPVRTADAPVTDRLPATGQGVRPDALPSLVGAPNMPTSQPANATPAPLIPTEELRRALQGQGMPDHDFGRPDPPMSPGLSPPTPIGVQPSTEDLLAALRGGPAPSMTPAPMNPVDSTKPPAFKRTDGQERIEDSPSRLRAALVTGLEGIARVGQIPGVSVAQTFAGGINSLAGAVNPEILNDQARSRNQEREATALELKKRRLGVDAEEAGIQHTQAATEELQGRPAREQAKFIVEAQAKERELRAKDDREWAMWYDDQGRGWKRFKDSRPDEPAIDPRDPSGKTQLVVPEEQVGYINGIAAKGKDIIGAQGAAAANTAKSENEYQQRQAEYEGNVAKLKAAAKGARAEAAAARAQKTALDEKRKASPGDDAYENSLDAGRYQDLQDRIDKAEAAATAAETQLSALPKPVRPTTAVAPTINAPGTGTTQRPVKTEAEWRAIGEAEKKKDPSIDVEELVRRAKANGQLR